MSPSLRRVWVNSPLWLRVLFSFHCPFRSRTARIDTLYDRFPSLPFPTHPDKTANIADSPATSLRPLHTLRALHSIPCKESKTTPSDREHPQCSQQSDFAPPTRVYRKKRPPRRRDRSEANSWRIGPEKWRNKRRERCNNCLT